MSNTKSNPSQERERPDEREVRAEQDRETARELGAMRLPALHRAA